MVARFLEIRENSGVMELSVEHRGFEGEEPIWMAIAELAPDVPELVREYLAERSDAVSQKKRRLAAKAKALLSN